MIYRIYISYKEGILDPEAEALKKKQFQIWASNQ